MKTLRRTVSASLLAGALAVGGLPAHADGHLDTTTPVTLNITTTTGSQVPLYEWAAVSFAEKYPNVSVNVTEYENDWYNQNAARLFASPDDSPDLAFFWLTGFYHGLVDAGVLTSLEDLYEEGDFASFLPDSSVRVATAKDGIKYGVSFSSIMSPLLMYNKKALADAGIEGEPATLEEMLSYGPALKEAGYIPWTSGLAKASQATQLFDINIRRHTSDATYAKLITKDLMDYTSPEIVAAFATMQRMANELMAPGSVGVENLEARALFAQGRAAFYSDGSWNLGPNALHKEIPADFDLGLMSYPPVEAGGNQTTGFYDANGLVIPVNSKKPEWAREFIKHILSFEIQSTMGAVMSQAPVRKDVTAQDLDSYHPDVAYIYEKAQSKGTHRLFNTIMPGEYRPAATQLIQGLVGGQLSPEEFAEEFTAMVQSIH